MQADQIERMFGGVPANLFRVHNWRTDVETLGEVPSDFVREQSEGKLSYSWPAQINRLVAHGDFDLILSIGQVVPHEVIGMQWSEFIGGDVVISPPYSWQVRFNSSDVEVRARIDKPVADTVIEELIRKFPDFRLAYVEDGLTVDEFDSFGPTRRTLRQFISACHDLDGLVRDFLLPDPDVL